MINLKSTSETKTTFTMVFDLSKEHRHIDIKQLKALSLLFGNMNPLRGELKDIDKCYDEIIAIKNNGEFIDTIYKLSQHFK